LPAPAHLQFAIAGLSKSTSLDGRKYGITCTQIDIGNAQTALGGHAAQGCLQADGSIKSEPMMPVENIGKTLVFLAGLDRAADVTHMEIM
jgi:NAD(P)-dependent dehydrogenase (short-subunit alcohol dehydrogenase family)